MPSPPPSAVSTAPMSLSELAGAAGAAGCPPGSPTVAGVATDSRTLVPGALFVALRGTALDGHSFLAAAVAAGAGALMIDAAAAAAAAAGQQPLAGLPCLVVPDTLTALANMASAWRRRRPVPTVAVTGSNGKTGTCALVAAAVAGLGPVHRTPGNLNNHVGVPLTLLARPPTAATQVVEMGMNAPGEIRRLAAMAAPDVGVITCVDVAHLGGPGLGSLAAIAAAKAELLCGLAEGGVAVINGDDQALADALPSPWPAGLRRLCFGRAEAADVRLVDARVGSSGTDIVLAAEGRRWPVRLPLLGVHHGMNAAAAGAAAAAVGLPAAQWSTTLAEVVAPPGRCQLRPAGALTLIDDTYNANPGSLRAAAGVLRALEGPRRRFLVVGDMGELGAEAARLHAEVGHWLAGLGLDGVFTLGPLSAHLADGVRAGGAAVASHAELGALCAALDAALAAGDAVLVKGSRSARMERVADHLWRAWRPV